MTNTEQIRNIWQEEVATGGASDIRARVVRRLMNDHDMDFYEAKRRVLAMRLSTDFVDHATMGIVQSAIAAKTELLDGPLEQHVGCAFDVWADDNSKRLNEHSITRVREHLNFLGFNW